jgi:hypothetical protein
MRKITSIIIISVLLASQAAYAGDGVCLRVPMGMMPARVILAQNATAIAYLEKVAEAAQRGECALRPSTKKIIDALIEIYKKNPNPSIEELVEKVPMEFDGIFYYEWRAALLKESLALTKYANNLLKNHSEIFNKNKRDKYQKMRDFLGKMVQIAVVKKINLPKEEMEILKKYIAFPDDTDSEAERKREKARNVIEAKQTDAVYKVISKYCGVLYNIKADSVKYMHEIFGPKEKFGRGDEHELDTAGIRAFTLGGYASKNKLIPLIKLHHIGEARYYILRGEIKRAVEFYKELLHPSAKEHGLSVVRDELIWMMRNKIDGCEEIARELNMDMLSAKETEDLGFSALKNYNQKNIYPFVDSVASFNVRGDLGHILDYSGVASAANSVLVFFKFNKSKEMMNALRGMINYLEEYIRIIKVWKGVDIKENAALDDLEDRFTDLYREYRDNPDFKKRAPLVLEKYYLYLIDLKSKLDGIAVYFEERNKVLPEVEGLVDRLGAGKPNYAAGVSN